MLSIPGQVAIRQNRRGTEIGGGKLQNWTVSHAALDGHAPADTDGFIKILADAQADEVLGVHMIGARVADLIAEAVVAMEFHASAEAIARISHSHPTYAEAVKKLH